MAKLIVLKLTNRYHQGTKLQEILTEFGCEIKTRLGLHETGDDFCSEEGIIVLQLCGEKKRLESLKRELEDLQGIEIRYLEI